MRAFPIGFPKVMISTMASRDTHSFVGAKDILMLHSVCDLAGLNRITEKILQNGAAAMAGMIRLNAGIEPEDKPLVVLSTLGTTEAGARALRSHLKETGREVITFHTVGAGGRAMEELVRTHDVQAVVELSFHELADHLFGGDYDAGPDRGRAAVERGVPMVLVPSNIDFLVSGPLKAAQETFPDRPYHVHNAAITALRTQPQEMDIMARKLAELCNESPAPIRVLIPLKGFSGFDSPGSPLHDPAAPERFATVFQDSLTRRIPVQTLPYHVNDDAFVDALIAEVDALLGDLKNR
jgi:uncharacterized protein (UPF0261 family)